MNPYIIYVVSFLLSCSLYVLGWSDLYPELTVSLIIFLCITFAVSLHLALTIKNSSLLKYTKIRYDSIVYRLTALAYIGWVADIIYSQSIPLFNIISGSKYLYNEFLGIPTIHVVLTSFQLFFCTYLFHVFISTKYNRIFYLYLLNITPFILTFSRSALLVVIIASLFIYINSISGGMISTTVKRFVLRIFPLSLAVLFLFGSVGNIRSTSQVDNTDAGNEMIFLIGEANSRFYNSGVPKDFFWAYVYISSPLANLQYNINIAKNNYPSSGDVLSFFINELMPDFISKRISESFGIQSTHPFLITPALTVGTVYTGSAYYLSWMGMIIMAIFIMTFPSFYLNLLTRNNGLYVSGVAILNTIYSLLIFDNMFKVSGISMTLVFPLILSKFLNFDIKETIDKI